MATKVPMLDMFKRVLPAIDTRNKSFIENLDEGEVKGFSPWLVMRYLSSAESANQDIVEHYLIMTNDIVNVNFSDIKDPEMTWKLMTIVGIGKSVKHPYVAPGKGKKKKQSAFKLWLKELYPHLDDQELDIMMLGFTKESARNILEQFQVKDKDIIAAANEL